MSLVGQWEAVESGLDPRWSDLQLSLQVDDPAARNRAAALLGPAQPGRAGDSLRFRAVHAGAGVGPDAVRRLLHRLDEEGIAGSLTLISQSEAETPAPVAAATLGASWDEAAAQLPPDWSDLVAELSLASSNDLDRAATLLSPLNPAQTAARPGYRFRSGRTAGYGASPGMVHRCLTRLDEDGIRGSVKVTHVLADTRPVGTQGAVFGAGGRRPT